MEFADEALVKIKSEVAPTVSQSDDVVSVKVEWSNDFETSELISIKKIKEERDSDTESINSDSKLLAAECVSVSICFDEEKLGDETGCEAVEEFKPSSKRKTSKGKVEEAQASADGQGSVHPSGSHGGDSLGDTASATTASVTPRTKAGILICDICSTTFKSKRDLKSHKRGHTDKKIFECEICNAKFTRLGSVNQHKRIHGEKSFKCDTCDAEFAQPNNLKRHRQIHTGYRPFVCEICNAKFTALHSLNGHKRIHNNEKPFECEICKAKFRHEGNLTKHKRTHTGERPFECEICKARFAHISNLAKHKRILHSGEKPFSCETCNAQFTRAGDLTKHKRIHIGETVPSETSRAKPTRGVSPRGRCKFRGVPNVSLVPAARVHDA